MADLIDRQALKAIYSGKCWHHLRNRINKLPAVDAVEVVRCKDCKHRRGDFFGSFVCSLHKGLAMVTDESFCSYGERRTDNE